MRNVWISILLVLAALAVVAALTWPRWRGFVAMPTAPTTASSGQPAASHGAGAAQTSPTTGPRLYRRLAAAGVWPNSRGNQRLTGQADGKLADELRLCWTFQTGDAIRTAPVVAEGKVYVGSDDGRLYALRLEDGKAEWAFPAGEAIRGSPCVADGRVAFGCLDQKVYCLDARTGRRLWSAAVTDNMAGGLNWARIDARASSQPTTGPATRSAGLRPASGTTRPASGPGAPGSNGAGERLIFLVGCNDGWLYALDGETGSTVWKYESKYYINGTPAVDGERVVFGSCDGNLYVLTADTGELERQVEFESYLPGSPALADGKAFFAVSPSSLLCADLDKGWALWRYEGEEWYTAPAIDARHVLMGGRDDRLHCVDRQEGKRRWSCKARGGLDSPPVICGDRVVIGSQDGRVYVLRLSDGREAWSYEIGAPISTAPAVVGGAIIVAADDGVVYAFGPN